jgi:hypothetical protein
MNAKKQKPENPDARIDPRARSAKAEGLKLAHPPLESVTRFTPPELRELRLRLLEVQGGSERGEQIRAMRLIDLVDQAEDGAEFRRAVAAATDAAVDLDESVTSLEESVTGWIDQDLDEPLTEILQDSPDITTAALLEAVKALVRAKLAEIRTGVAGELEPVSLEAKNHAERMKEISDVDEN